MKPDWFIDEVELDEMDVLVLERVVDVLALLELTVLVDVEEVVVVVVLGSVRFDEYFSVTLVTLIRRYFSVMLLGGASVR